MNQFIRCLLGEETLPGFDDIYSEYIGLRENKSSSYVLDLIKEITYLQTKIFIITKCVEVLAHTYSRDLVSELKQTGVKGRFDWSDKEQYSKDLKAAISYSKKYNGQINRKQIELDEYNKRHGGKTIERKDFEIWRVTLFKYYGSRIDFDEITVAEWAVMLNEYERYCEIVNAENNNMLNGAGQNR